MEIRELAAPRVVRFASLEPRWTTRAATEPGYLRWLVSYVGGREGFLNASPESGLLSERVVVGVMVMPAGNRQYGLHVHTVSEIYVMLRGRVESLGVGEPHLAGPLDCVSIPAGAPHGVRAVGSEDVVLLWFHDAVEANGLSVYYDGEADAPRGGPPMQPVAWSSVEPDWSQPGAKEGGGLRWQARWSPSCSRVAFGATTILAGNAEPLHEHDAAETLVVASGTAALVGGGGHELLAPLDAVVVPPGLPHGLRAVGLEPLVALWVRDAP